MKLQKQFQLLLIYKQVSRPAYHVHLTSNMSLIKKQFHVMVVVCVSRLLLGFLLLIVKLSPASKVDVTSTLDGQEDIVVQNYQLLLQLGLVQPTGSAVDPHWMLPHGVFLF